MLRTVVGSSLYLTVVVVIGLALGALLRKTAAGLSVFAAVFFVVPIVVGALPHKITGFAPYLPSNAGGALWGNPLTTAHALSPWAGFAVPVRLRGRADRPGRLAAAPPRRLTTRKGCEDTSMSFWTPVENPGTRPPRSWVFDIGCALLAAAASFGTFSFAQTAHPALPPLAVSLIVAVLTALVLSLRRVWPGPVFGVMVLMAAVLAQWPVRGALFPVALAIGLYTVAATMSRTTALVAAALAVAAEIPAAGQGGWHNGWLAVIYEVIAIAAVLVAGLYTSTRRAYLAELRDRAQRLEREHDQTSALAAAVERARIAREMHDSVAHHLTVIVALSDGALAAVNRSPVQAADAIRGVSATAREALAETRRLLGILRADSGLGTPAAAARPVRP